MVVCDFIALIYETMWNDFVFESASQEIFEIRRSPLRWHVSNIQPFVYLFQTES